ncbi:MAG: autotransporter outer membrane beta-barrel domain-containing protein [Woeseiaceae bacterium]|nr:autotransporter outer membrane beta-barrel domain-containing protein [Woeseiaceae bacterium]
MTKFLRALHSKIVYAFSLLVALGCLLGSQTAMAQGNIPGFFNGLADPVSANIEQSALAIQRTCGELIQTGFVSTTGTSGGNELWRRCNELVATADSIWDAKNGGLPGAGGSTSGRTLGYTADEDMLAAFQQVNGEETLSQSSLAQSGTYEQFSTIGARLTALRGASSASVTSVAANGTDFMYGSGGGAAADDAPFSPWGWFVRGTYASGDRDPSDPNGFIAAEDGFDFDQYGLTFGVDHSSGPSVWGIAVSYTSYDLEMQTLGAAAGAGSTTNRVNKSTIESDSTTAMVYFDYTSDSNVYFSVLAGFGGQSFDLARSFVYVPTCTTTCGADVVTQNRTLVGAPGGDSQAGTFSVGQMIQSGSWVIDPHLGLTFDNVSIDRFAESDTGNESGQGLQDISAMNLAFDKQDIKSFRATLGVQISKNVNTSFGSVRPTFSVDYHHEFEDDPRELRVKYQLEDTLINAAVVDPATQTNDFAKGFNCTVSCFSLFSEAPDSDFFVVGAGVAASYRSGLQAFLMLEGLLGYDDLSTYALTIGLRGQF